MSVRFKLEMVIEWIILKPLSQNVVTTIMHTFAYSIYLQRKTFAFIMKVGWIKKLVICDLKRKKLQLIILVDILRVCCDDYLP